MKKGILALALALSLFPVAGNADLDDFERARQARELGEARPLAEILRIIEQETRGHVVEIEFELEPTRDIYIYEFELIAPDGRLLKAIVDPKSGDILSIGEDEDEDD
jgi:uncharacterized membrane protein YkoI